MTRAGMWGLLALVAGAAAVLSFSALRDLAILCGFHAQLAWLLPVVVDAGAGAGCLVWLGTGTSARALRFARSLTWVLLASSVAGNAVVHGLSAYGLRPPWWLVVIVSAIAPAVLGAIVHLAVLVGRADVAMSDTSGHADGHRPEDDLLARARELAPIGRRPLARALGVTEHQARTVLDRLAQESEPRNGAQVMVP